MSINEQIKTRHVDQMRQIEAEIQAYHRRIHLIIRSNFADEEEYAQPVEVFCRPIKLGCCMTLRKITRGQEVFPDFHHVVTSQLCSVCGSYIAEYATEKKKLTYPYIRKSLNGEITLRQFDDAMDRIARNNPHLYPPPFDA